MDDTLQKARETINEVDRQMVALFEQRMQAAAAAGAYKRAQGLPVRDEAREEALLRQNLSLLQNQALAPYYSQFLQQLLSLSRQWQTQLGEEA